MSKYGPKLTIRQVTEARKLRGQGATISELAARYDVSEPGILRHVRDVPPPLGGWKKSGGPRVYDYARLARMRANGATVAEIRRLTGASHMTVWLAVRERSAARAA